jgi:hypothetical protein
MPFNSCNSGHHHHLAGKKAADRACAQNNDAISFLVMAVNTRPRHLARKQLTEPVKCTLNNDAISFPVMAATKRA